MELTLLGRTGDDTRRYMLANGETLIGRRPDCRIVLDAPSISPRHARLFTVDGHAVIHALDDAWPVYVNGEPVKRRVLADGDDIQLGHYRMRYGGAGHGAGGEALEEPTRGLTSMDPGGAADPAGLPLADTVPLNTDQRAAAAETEETMNPQRPPAVSGDEEPAAAARADTMAETTDTPERAPDTASSVTAYGTPAESEDGAPQAAEIVDPESPDASPWHGDGDQDDTAPAEVEDFDEAPSPVIPPDTATDEALYEASRPFDTAHPDSLGSFPTAFQAPSPETADAAVPIDSGELRPATGDTASSRAGAFHLDILTGINQGRRVSLTKDLVVLGFNRQRLVELRTEDGALWLRRLDDDAAAELNGAPITEEPSEAKPDDVISLQRIDLRIHRDQP